MPNEPEKSGEGTPEPGSPEDVAAKLAAAEAAKNQDGDGDGSDGASDSKPKGDGDDGGDGKPEVIEVPRAEHDATAYELRKLRKEKRDREAAEADQTRVTAQEKAKAEGDYDTGIELERTEKKAALAKVQTMGLKVALSDAAEEREWGATQRKLARKLIDREKLEFDDEGEPLADSLSAALDALVAEYPESFAATGDEDPEKSGKSRTTRRTPATPRQDGKPFDGYLTPEEFVDTPREVRLTPEFQAKVEKSKPFWPDKVPHSSFPGGQGEG